ncbi:hypothetical protein MTR67_048716 [Solanum verrucosum]|uniref:Isopenicillin N synthase-like Fe(2+) 2OG dioxygenase domain-containing protein n=1 Tax=Solanum verrucosum TaxID=315347 RepID=A0AAF0V260_SOLVR|nr:hypothetical protein MTR67_048716 [Solanum verrucosum]
MLRKCMGDPSLIIPTEDIGIKDSLSYEEISVQILDRQVRKLRTKEVASVKVLWRNQFVEKSTWEAEEYMKKRYPHLFETGEVPDQEPLLMGTMAINIKYYPPCPNPSITIGARRHYDVSCITLLFQDDTRDLYARGAKGDNWIHINPIKGALAVNIGDSL